MMSRPGLAVTLILAAVLAGCATPEFTASGVDPYPPYQGEVELLQQLPAPGSYELVGVVMVRGVKLSSDTRMYDDLKAMAGERGADAVIPQGAIKDRPTTAGGEERRLAGYAIRRKR